jgi:hypothetical protein
MSSLSLLDRERKERKEDSKRKEKEKERKENLEDNREEDDSESFPKTPLEYKKLIRHGASTPLTL